MERKEVNGNRGSSGKSPQRNSKFTWIRSCQRIWNRKELFYFLTSHLRFGIDFFAEHELNQENWWTATTPNQTERSKGFYVNDRWWVTSTQYRKSKMAYWLAEVERGKGNGSQNGSVITHPYLANVPPLVDRARQVHGTDSLEVNRR